MPSRKAIDNSIRVGGLALSKRVENFRLTFLRPAHAARANRKGFDKQFTLQNCHKL
jgi:hypothetical protein